MIKYHYQLFKIIAILTIALLMIGCSHQKVSKEDSNQQVIEEMRVYIKSLPDPERAKQLLIQLDALNQGITEMDLIKKKFTGDLQTLFFRYEATRGDFKELLDDFNSTRKSLQQNILTSYFKMKSLTLANEWEELAKMQEKVFSDGMRQTLLDK